VAVAPLVLVAVLWVPAVGADAAGAGPAPPAVPTGTLRIAATGELGPLDTCCAEYTETSALLRLVSRQLVSFRPAAAGSAFSGPVGDLATVAVSPDGLTYTFTIRRGADWDAPTGPRQVTSTDAQRGIERLCNPVVPAPELGYWTGVIQGMAAFCRAFETLRLPPDPAGQVAAIAAFLATHRVTGISTPSARTVVFRLLHPSSTFLDVLALPMSSPVPVEALSALPGSLDEAQHLISDGPYTVASSIPGVGDTFVPNPAWQQRTDPIRHQYVATVSVTEAEDPAAVVQQLASGQADLGWGVTEAAAPVAGLRVLAPFSGAITYLVFNLRSRADHGALARVAVRRALQYCVDRRQLVQVSGGPGLDRPLDQVLPPTVSVGSRPLHPFPTPHGNGDPARCRSMLAAAGYPHGLTLTLLDDGDAPMPAQASALVAEMANGGVTLRLAEQPSWGAEVGVLESPAERSQWDVALATWYPDWPGNDAASYLGPLLCGRGPLAGPTNYGGYDDPVVDRAVSAAEAAASARQAAADWERADVQATERDPAWVPLLTQAVPQLVGADVVHARYLAAIAGVDPTDLWIEPSAAPPGAAGG